MIGAAPENFSYIEVTRKIENGAEFLAAAQQIGNSIICGEYRRSSIAEVVLTQPDDGSEPELVTTEVPVAEPLFRVTDKNHFELVLLHRAVHKARASRFSFGHTLDTLAADQLVRHVPLADEEAGARRAKVLIPGLRKEFDRIQEECDVNSFNQTVVFNDIRPVNEPGRDIILGLNPRGTDKMYQALYQQSYSAYRAIGGIGGHRADPNNGRWNNPSMPWSITAPFAKIPNTVSVHDRVRLIGVLSAQLLDVRLSLGEYKFNLHLHGSRPEDL